jgi:hypothetical protein
MPRTWPTPWRNQENVRSYVKVMVRNNLLSVENIRSRHGARAERRSGAAVTSTGAARTEARARLWRSVPWVDKVVMHPARK